MPDYGFYYDSPKVRISDSEIVVQKACRRSVAIMLPKTRLVAIPNGSKRTIWQQRQAKAEGLTAGFPDMIAVGPQAAHPHCPVALTAYVEIKAKSSMSVEQREWLEWLHGHGHYCGVFRSDQTLVEKLKQWGFR